MAGFADVVVSTFGFHVCVCMLKLYAMGALTSLKRVGTGIFSNPEDCKVFGSEKIKPKFDDQRIERVRRNHLNDLENIIPFVLVGAFYCLSGPVASTAIWHFRIFTASRFLHMLAYQIPLPQPLRATSHFVGMLVTISMAVQVFRATSW